MGVDFYSCDNCSRNFPDCSWNATWCDCGGKFCSKECSGKDENETCNLCRMEIIKDDDLLSFLLKHYGITREQAGELYRNGKQGKLSSSS